MHWTELLLVAFAVALAAAAPARAQTPLPADLSLDPGFAPPNGVARDDLATGTGPDNAFATAVHEGRIYVVGESANNVGIVARRSNGTLDDAFSEDGKLVIALGTNRDAAVDIVVLPDGRLRILALQTSQTNTADTDIALIGLNPDGSDDTEFGGGDGRVSFPVGPRTDTPSRLRADAAGRLAIAGFTRDTAGREDGFVSLRAPDGAPAEGFGVNGVRELDRAADDLDDRALDVEFRPGGLVVAMQVATNADTTIDDFITVLHAVSETGEADPSFSEDGDLVLEPGEPNTGPTALLAHGGRLWVTGSAAVGTDVDAFIARLELDGSGVQTRRYDVRDDRIPAEEAVVTVGRRLAVLPGEPETLVVVGSTSYLSHTYYSAIAFNDLGNDLDRLSLSELLIVTDENSPFGLLGVAAGDGWLVATGSLRNPNNSLDSGFGTVRLLVDADKTCDLALELVSPFELVFAGADPAVQLKVTNEGTKTCSGSVSASGAYGLRVGSQSAPIPTGSLAPGASFTSVGATVSYAGPRRREDRLTFAVTAAGDANTRNDTRSLGVVFSFCDISLSPVGSALLPSEGSRTFEFNLRNGGSTSCSRVRVTPDNVVLGTGTGAPFSVPAGLSYTEEVVVRPPGRAKPGDKVALGFHASADGDVDPANNSATITPTLIGVGDSEIRRTNRLAVSGRTRAGRGPIAKRRLRVSRVDVAIRLAGEGCRWLASARTMKVRRLKADRSGGCSSPRWLLASGTRSWRLRLARKLPRGTHTVLSRATIAAGFPEASFTRRDRNLVRLRVG